MSIESVCSMKMNKALAAYGEDIARSVIEALSTKYGFPLEEALSSFSVTVSEKKTRATRESRPSSRATTRTSVPPSMLPMPFCGKAVDGWCSGIRPNGGLFTQCSNEPNGDSPYCATCQRQAEKNEHGLPNGGDIGERIAKGDDWRCPKGKAPIRLANFLKKSGKELTDELRQQITEAAESFGWTIADDEWEVKSASRGRPRKEKTAVVDTTATEDEEQNSSSSSKKTSRKVKKTNSGSELEQASDNSDGEELVLATPSKSSMVKRRSESPSSPAVISPIEDQKSGSISPIEAKPKKVRKPKMTAEEKEAAKAAKAEEKRIAKEAAAAAKLAEKEAAKAAKAEEKRIAKEAAAAAKAAEKEAAKAAKAEEKRIAKAAKLAEKEAAKAAKLAEQEEIAAVNAAVEAVKDAREEEPGKEVPAEPVSPADDDEESRPADPEHDVYEAETENEDSDDDDDEDAAGVEEFEHKGKKYLRDPNTNDIFDHAVFMETGEAEEIGVYNTETDTINFHDEDDE